MYKQAPNPKLFNEPIVQVSLVTSEDLDFTPPMELAEYVPPGLFTAVNKRKNEFALGRHAAALACRRFGVKKVFISQNPDKTPNWPKNFVGSITHTKGFAAAAVAPSALYRSLGIDAECLVPSNDLMKITKVVSLTSERDYYTTIQSQLNPNEFYTLTFSAKESLYKALHPLTHDFFWFSDAEISEVDRTRGTFTYTLHKTLNREFKSGYQGKGYFEITIDKVHTGVYIGAAE